MNEVEPIFVVGVQRSGTTLLAAMLAAHSRLSCGPETHFFRRLLASEKDPICSIGNWPRPAVDFICSIRHSAFSDCEGKFLIEKYGMTQAEVNEYLKTKKACIPTILSSVTEQYMVRMGKKRWVEKTPDHLLYAEEIRRYFPNAPIVRIIRDPRDVALSLTRVPWGVATFLEGLVYWARLDDASNSFFNQDEHSYTLRFEDLVTTPDETLRKLCHFLGEEFESGMIDTSITGRQINSRNVPWKGKASQSVDRSRSSVWKVELTRQQNQLAEALVGDRLGHYGYPRKEKFEQLAELYPAGLTHPGFLAQLTPLAAAGVRFWKSSESERPTLRVYWGDPENNRWLPENRIAKALGALAISASIIRDGFFAKSLYWIPERDAKEWTGYCSLLVKRLLLPYRLSTGVFESPRLTQTEAQEPGMGVPCGKSLN